LTLLVSSRASSAVTITFALTAHQLLGWLAYPWLGRASDRSRARIGRRTAFLGAGLVVAGVATALLPHAPGYWALVALIVTMRLAFAAYWAPAHALLPESFGRSRWLKAVLVTAAVSFVSAHVVRAVAIMTWRHDDSTTWALPFEVAGGLTVVAGLAILGLVRQPADLPARRAAGLPSWRHRVQEILAAPNARVLVTALLLDAASFGATGRLVAVFFAEELGAGGREQATGGLVGLWAGVAAGFAGVWLIRRVSAARLAVGFPAAAAVIAMVHLVVTHYWHALALEVAMAPLAAASFLALAPLYARLLPSSLGLGEVTGLFLGPKAAVSVGAGYLAAVVVDITGTYRVIWWFPVVLQLAKAAAMARLRFPHSRSRLDLNGLFRTVFSGCQRQMARPLLRGPLDSTDADTSSVVGSVRAALENAYITDEEADEALRHRRRHLSPKVVRSAVAPECRAVGHSWHLAGSRPGNYDMRVAPGRGPRGHPAAVLRSTAVEPGGFASMTNAAPGAPWRGRQVRVSANLRGVDISGGGGVWLRVDGPGTDLPYLAFANMWDRKVVGTVEWRLYHVVVDVPDRAARVAWGAYLNGSGELSVSDLRFEAVRSEESNRDPANRDDQV